MNQASKQQQWTSEFETILRRYLPGLGAKKPLSGEASLADVGLDSLSILAVVVALEDAFDVEMPDDAVVPENFLNASAVWSLLSGLVAAENDGTSEECGDES